MLFECAQIKSQELELLLGKKNSRFFFEEFILRFFAFQDDFSIYTGRLTSFLNDYMDKNRNLSAVQIRDKRDFFIQVIDVLYSNVQEQPKFSKVMLEAILYGIGKNLDNVKSKSESEFSSLCEAIFNSQEFKPDLLKDGLMQQTKVKDRLVKSEEVFSG